MARNLYRLWFSHPAVHAITWWNLPDGGAAPGEDTVASGLVDREMRPKISYQVLQDLIRREWRTNTQATSEWRREHHAPPLPWRYRARLAGADLDNL